MEAHRIYAIVTADSERRLNGGNAKDHLNFAFFLTSDIILSDAHQPQIELELFPPPNGQTRGQLLIFKQGDGDPFKVIDDIAPFEAGVLERMGLGRPRLICKMRRNFGIGNVYTERFHEVLAELNGQEGTHALSSKKWFATATRMLKREEVLAHSPDQPKTDVLIKWLEDKAVEQLPISEILNVSDIPAALKVQGACEIV